MNAALESLNPYFLVISDFMNDVPVLLQSEAAIVTYAWLAMTFAIFLSLSLAIFCYRALEGFRPSNLITTYVGPKPKKTGSIEKRIKDMRDKVAVQKRKLGYRSAYLLIAALLVPGGCLAIMILFETLLLNSQSVLMVGTVATTADQLAPMQIILFIGDQAMRGALNNFIEVCEISITEVSHNSSNWIFSSFILLYRMLTGVAMVALVVATIKTALGQRILGKAIKNLDLDRSHGAATT
tara:strand:- start:110 stop:826 length:717 start_codon:yes stop_codon:yes gene_type:complete